RLPALLVGLAAAVCLGRPECLLPGDQPQEASAKSSTNAWTLEEAQEQLRLQPRDPYLQYVVLQLARRNHTVEGVAPQIEQIIQGPGAREQAMNRVNQVDLFSIFTGALAVQESLQLDTMRGGPANPRINRPVAPGEDPKARLEKRRQETVAVADLAGPSVESHPWKKMLAGKKPEVSPLARAVPNDYYLVEFHSLTKMLEAMDQSDLWSTHLFDQAVREARTQQVGERIKKQLAVETTPLLRPFYDGVVEDVAVTGSDLFLREGSDVTLLFRIKQPDLFKTRMDGFLTHAARDKPSAVRSTGKYLDVDYVHLGSPDREVNVFSAYPAPDLHIRSNSKVAFQHVLEALKGKNPEGKPVPRLGETAEYGYIRTLMPLGAKEEDGFIYLSDPFIHRLVSPQVKLTERRRMVCYNHLRMVGHASMLYRTEHGKRPESLEELFKAQCCPEPFNEGLLRCPDGGTYSLSKDGSAGVCSHHGPADFLTPCCEIPVTSVNGEEANEYKAFVEDYNQYWRIYFDPIALRLQITPQRYRLETIVLPLIDNSIYTGMSMVLGGQPEPLDALPVPKRNILTVAARLNKEALLPQAGLTAQEENSPAPKGPNHPNATDVQCVNNLKQIGLALYNYHDANRHFPAVANFDKDGKPLLSWRVQLLPYLEQQGLYNEFHQDEPWDSEHNKKLIDRMPAVFHCPAQKSLSRGKTTYLAPVGKGTMFTGKGDGLTIPYVTDGTSNTIFIVDADAEHAVPWTKPDDLTYDPKKPQAGLSHAHQGLLPTLFVDGSVHYLRNTIDADNLRGLFTINGGEVTNLDENNELVQNARHGPFDLDFLNQKEYDQLKVGEFLSKGIGDQVALNIYDATPLFDFNLPAFLGLMMGSFNGGHAHAEIGTEELLISFLISSLNSPVYISIPVQDAKVVDQFLDRLDAVMAVQARQQEGGFLPLNYDFYRFPAGQDKEKRFRSFALSFGPVKWRLFWARIGDGFYIASKAFILEDLLKEAKAPAGDKGPEAHAMIRLRPQNWDRVLPEYRLSWAENNREACVNNLGPLSSVARAFVASLSLGKLEGAEAGKISERIHQTADRLYGVHFFCPEGGRYVLAPDGKSMVCTVHGSVLDPRQPAAPSEQSPLGSLLDHFTGMTASLTFLENGLHAVVVIDRK
ncbi:MAG: DUF1559 domain-containing protein, partial [Planctomycetes bacterium]|nr:DUF1559 domain-containing protein [Planctomycetota bacterium]